MAVLDDPDVRGQSLTHLAVHWPAFCVEIYETGVVQTLSLNNDAVIECWARQQDAADAGRMDGS
jgi:hypothetical protein